MKKKEKTRPQNGHPSVKKQENRWAQESLMDLMGILWGVPSETKMTACTFQGALDSLEPRVNVGRHKLL